MSLYVVVTRTVALRRCLDLPRRPNGHHGLPTQVSLSGFPKLRAYKYSAILGVKQRMAFLRQVVDNAL